MPARLSRKRYTEITRYLKAVIDDPNKSDRLRMTAVESLLEVFARHDRTELQKEARKRASDAPQDAEQPIAPPENQETQHEALDALLTRIKAEREKGVNVEQ